MKALCITGGAFKGYVQVPILKHLMKKNKYDLVYGVSIGAMNGAMAAQNKFDELDDIWESINRRSDALPINWSRPFSGLYSMRVLRGWAKKYAKLDDLKTPFAAGVVSLNNGKYYMMKTSNMKSDKEFANSVIASSSITGLMDTGSLIIDGYRHDIADGGFKSYIPIPDGKRYTEIDVVMCDPYERITDFGVPRNIVKKVIRTIEILQDEILYRDLEVLERKCFANKTTLRIFAPPTNSGPFLSINKELKEIRYRLGMEAIKNPVIIDFNGAYKNK